MLLPHFDLNGTEINLIDALIELGLASSRSEAKTLILGNAVSVNNQKIQDPAYQISSFAILKRGKNKFAIVK